VDYVDWSQIHLNAKKGSYTITVKMGHIL
jgi:hypothetical protein